MLQPPAKAPMISAPRSVIIVFALLICAHAGRTLLPPDIDVQLIVYGALFPARFLAEGAYGLPGGWGVGIFNLLSYNFLHANWTHVLMNAFWLLAFGTPIARRAGAKGFLLVFVFSSVAGGLCQIFAASSAAYLVPIVGASAGVSGLMGAATRFVFSPRHRQAVWPERPRLLTTRETLQQPIALAFITIWLGINLLSGALAPLGLISTDGSAINIAWIAHLGGFVAGFYLLPIFDKPPLSPSGGPGRVDYGAWR